MTSRQVEELRVGDMVTASDGMRGTITRKSGAAVEILWANGYRDTYALYEVEELYK
jgi:preprotein translocase subunit YajC